ncbi:hypothetical protein MCAMS1_02862 [biofilm metagenome]
MIFQPEKPAKVTGNSSDDSISDQAGDWFAKVRSGAMSAEEISQFKQWLQDNPAHNNAYKDIEAFWNNADFNDALSATPLSDAKVLPSRYRPINNSWAVISVAAGIAFLTILLKPMLGCVPADYCTATGEIRKVQLAEGSTITLGPQTTINVSLNSKLRQVQLLKGEALFSVQRNTASPFIVNSQYSQTRVLGTQFNVKGNAEFDTITVISGVVEVSRNQQQSTLLHANDSITVDSLTTGTVKTSSGNAASAWAKGHLVFANTALNEVVGEIGRFRHGTIIVKNNRLKALKVSGRFDITDTDKALDALEQSLPIRVYHLTPWFIVIA